MLSNACDWSLSFEAIGKTLSQQPTQLIGLTRTVSATELATVQSHFALPFSKYRDLYKALWDTVKRFSKVNPCLRAKLIALVQPNYIALGDSAYLEEYTESLVAIERSHFSEHRFEEIENGGIEWSALWHRVLTKDPMVGVPCYPWEFEEVFAQMEQRYQSSSSMAARLASGSGKTGTKRKRRSLSKQTGSDQSSSESDQSSKFDADQAMKQAGDSVRRLTRKAERAQKTARVAGDKVRDDGEAGSGFVEVEGGAAKRGEAGAGEDKTGGEGGKGLGEAGGEDTVGGGDGDVVQNDGDGAEPEEDLRDTFGE